MLDWDVKGKLDVGSSFSRAAKNLNHKGHEVSRRMGEIWAVWKSFEKLLEARAAEPL